MRQLFSRLGPSINDIGCRSGFWAFVMRFFRAILILFVLAGALNLGGFVQLYAAEGPGAEAGAAGKEEHSLPQQALQIGHIGSFPITNSMLVSWGVALILIIFARVAMRHPKEIPAGAQNFWEWMVESLHNFLEGIIGHKLV